METHVFQSRILCIVPAKKQKTKLGGFRGSNSGPLAPKARIMPLDQSPKTTECGRSGRCDGFCWEERLGACREGWTWCSWRSGREGRRRRAASGRGVLGRRRALAVVPRSFPLAGCVPGGALRAPINTCATGAVVKGNAFASAAGHRRRIPHAGLARRRRCASGRPHALRARTGPAPPDIAAVVGRSGQDFPAHARRRHDGDIGGPAPTREPAA